MSAICYVIFCTVCVVVLKEFNAIVDKPYMDEPFHVPQAQAYCLGQYMTWDPKITTPPGLYVMSLILKTLFMFKCTLSMLRLTTLLSLMSLPIALSRLLCYHQRQRSPQSVFVPTLEATILSVFPIAWFFGFLYYTEVPSLVLVTWTVVAASQRQHWLAALLGLISCTFRQTNVLWVLYAYVSSQLMYLRFRRAAPGAKPLSKLHDPHALAAQPGDLVRSLLSVTNVILDVLPAFIPYMFVLAVSGVFVVWNGGIVLGDKLNHIPSLHIPQLYYFFAFATVFGWPALISGQGGTRRLIWDVLTRMFGSARRTLASVAVSLLMSVTVHLFTLVQFFNLPRVDPDLHVQLERSIHHPFLLSDNRHYTFYVWRRVYMLHPTIPYVLVPAYLACAWAWFLRTGRDQTLLQNLILPIFVLLILMPTPLLEPRYFLVPYTLLRAQVSDMPTWALYTEGLWYSAINTITMWVFLYKEREGVGRFMW